MAKELGFAVDFAARAETAKAHNRASRDIVEGVIEKMKRRRLGSNN
jgi:hypothetical protein